MAEVWDGSPQAYLGTTVTGFPNLALMWGPNTASASIAWSVDSQTPYVRGLVRAVLRTERSRVEVRGEAQEAFKRFSDEYSSTSAMEIGGCMNWYVDDKGKNVALYPGSMAVMRKQLGVFDTGVYDVEHDPASTGTVAANI